MEETAAMEKNADSCSMLHDGCALPECNWDSILNNKIDVKKWKNICDN